MLVRIPFSTRAAEIISRITITSNTGFRDLKQIRFLAGTGSFTVIPEPGTLSLLGTGLLGLAGMLRRKLKV